MRFFTLTLLLVFLSQKAVAQWADSNIVWVDNTFNKSVQLLLILSNYLGITYEEINVWLFVIILPSVLFISLLLNAYFLFIKGQQESS